MKLLTKLSIATSMLLTVAAPGFAAVTVTSPYSGSTVSSPFTLTANASACSSEPISAIGYSLDASTDTVSVSGAYLQKSIAIAAGGHTIHIKSWGSKGALCVKDVAVIVNGGSASSPISVNKPMNGSTVSSPFQLSASAATCNGQAVSALGYSFDDGVDSVTVGGTVLNKSVSVGTGGHTLHIKAWGKNGASCVQNVAVNVGSLSATPVATAAASATTTASAAVTAAPSGAKNVGNLQSLKSWTSMHDAGTTGSSSGTMSIMKAPSRTGSARHFMTKYAKYGGQRYAVSFGDDTTSKNLIYDAWVYIQNSAKGVKVIEMDMNQVMANGWTIIYGFQCNGWSGTWDYASNKGSIAKPAASWHHTKAACSPQKWAVNKWHHVTINYSRDDKGYVTYKSVTFDGATQSLNARVLSAFNLHWGKIMLTNFQVDGGTSTSGSSSIFLDDLTISHW